MIGGEMGVEIIVRESKNDRRVWKITSGWQRVYRLEGSERLTRGEQHFNGGLGANCKLLQITSSNLRERSWNNVYIGCQWMLWPPSVLMCCRWRQYVMS